MTAREFLVGTGAVFPFSEDTMSQTTRDVPVLEWTGCYKDDWASVIVPDAFRHPAKFARGLISRIYTHAMQQGWLKAGDTVVDPFGGVACGAIDAMMHGLHWVGCELEENFCVLARQNIDVWVKRWGHQQDWGTARILQGDSRQLGAVIAGADAVVSLPPYATETERLGKIDWTKTHHGSARAAHGAGACSYRDGNKEGYGTTPGQLGSMPLGDVDAVLSSPPYAQVVTGSHGETETAQESRDKRQTAGGSLGQSQRHGGYGVSPGNLSGLKEGEVDGVVSSPPYEGNVKSDYQLSEDGKRRQRDENRGYKQGEGCFRGSETYGSTEGQLGLERSDTFWSAARDIVAQCHQILRPGGVAIWVCKNFVRAGQIVPFSDQWRLLCESQGFATIQWIKASLVVETRQPSLFGGEEVKKKERKSFFRRLHEKKAPHLKIDHEDIVIMAKGGSP